MSAERSATQATLIEKEERCNRKFGDAPVFVLARSALCFVCSITFIKSCAFLCKCGLRFCVRRAVNFEFLIARRLTVGLQPSAVDCRVQTAKKRRASFWLMGFECREDECHQGRQSATLRQHHNRVPNLLQLGQSAQRFSAHPSLQP